MLTLWDLARPMKRLRGKRLRKDSSSTPRTPPRTRDGPKALLYATMTRELLDEHGIRVRKWRTHMSGVAWRVSYTNGSMTRLIEAPRPKGPMSAAIFLHEIGHHVIGLGRYRPRCLEEFHAWKWSLEEMDRRGIAITDNVRKRMHESLHYAIAKARRRGLKQLPPELEPYRDPL